MLFADGKVEIPDRLLDSLERDKLVIFTGAGVSKGPPSSLPLFKGLAEDIAGGRKVTEPYDRFLGKLAHEGTNVHALAADALRRRNPDPNDLHRDLLGLFGSAKDARVITTNYDLLFEKAAAKLFAEPLTVYNAPALPLGSDFRGVVHLHGALDDRDDRMVLTDGDFGRAYLSEGWARRFLMQLFQKFDVLFVGYSHNDVVMNYLARGLPPNDGVT